MEDHMKRLALALLLSCLLMSSYADAADKPAAEAAPAAESKAATPAAVAPAAEPAPPAAAPSFETPVTDPVLRAELEKVAAAHQRYADDFGLKKFAFGNIVSTRDSTTYSLKYLPEGENLTSWKNMMAMTVYNLPADSAAARVYMSKTIAMLEGLYKKNAGIITDQKFTDNNDDPMLFFEFMMGKADQAVYTSAIFLRTGKDTAAFIQYESRGKPVSSEMSVKMKEVVFLEAK
jgi:hypothetical protein